MGMRATTAVLVATIALPAAGCGSGQHRAPASAGTARSPSTGPGAPAPHAAVDGHAVFTEHCSVCHSLSGIDTPRLQGGDLLGFHAARAEVVQFVREMPVVHRPLTHAELQAVVDYVIAAERRAARR